MFPTMPICPQRYGACLLEGCHGTVANSVGSHPTPPLLSGMPDDAPFETLCGCIHSGQVCKNPEDAKGADSHYAETTCVLFLERLCQCRSGWRGIGDTVWRGGWGVGVFGYVTSPLYISISIYIRNSKHFIHKKVTFLLMNTESRWNSVLYSVFNILYYTGAVLSFMFHENTRTVLRLILFIYSFQYGLVILCTIALLLVICWYRSDSDERSDETPFEMRGHPSSEQEKSPTHPILFITYHHNATPTEIGVSTHPPR